MPAVYLAPVSFRWRGSRAARWLGFIHRHPVRFEGVKLLAADLADQTETSRIFQELRPSSVVHCAAETRVTGAKSIPTKPTEST